MAVLNRADADLLDWATHLARLAKVVEPTSNRVRLLEGRCLLRRGERDAGVQVLEDVRESPKGLGTKRRRGTTRRGCWASCTSKSSGTRNWR